MFFQGNFITQQRFYLSINNDQRQIDKSQRQVSFKTIFFCLDQMSYLAIILHFFNLSSIPNKFNLIQIWLCIPDQQNSDLLTNIKKKYKKIKMNKNSIVNIIYQKSLSRQWSQKSTKAIYGDKQKINSKIQFPQGMETVSQSNKMIKITQFNSSLFTNDERLLQKGYKTSNSTSPQKNFNIKKVNEFKNKAIINAQKIIEIELKRRDQVQKGRKYIDEVETCEDAHKHLLTSKWSLRSESPSTDPTGPGNHISQTVIVLRPTEKRQESHQRSLNHLQLGETILLGKSKDIQPLKPKDHHAKISTSKEKSRPRLHGEQVFIGGFESDGILRKLSASPRKNYSKHLEEQKRYQQNIEKQKREILEMKRQLNKNYAKPFNPPQNVTAFSYIIYQADIKKSKKLRKYSAKRQQAQQMTQIRKIFLHSHQVVVSLNSRTAVEMASLTKIMTCIIALDIGKRYNLNLSEQIITIGLFEQNIGGTSANIKKGQIYSIQQLLYGLMLPSGNDASLAIAVWGGKVLMQRQIWKKDTQISSGGSSLNPPEQKTRPKIKKRQYYQKFIAQMNQKANELNMQKTKYCNSHGLSHPDNRSCAFDLAILSEYAMNNNDFRRIVSCKIYQTQIRIQSNQRDSMMSKDSRKSLKKKTMPSVNKQGLMELQEMKDMNQMFQDKFVQEDVVPVDQQKQTEIKMVRWQNTHQLVQQKSDLYIGIKTGITNTAGPCLASCLQIRGRRFIIIVLNCKSMKYRMKDTEILRKWLFSKESFKYHEKNMEKMSIEEDNKFD